MIKGRLAFIHANNHCMEPTGFKWSYLRMLKPADSFAVPGDSSVKASCFNEGIYSAYSLGAEWFFLMDVDQLFPPMTIPLLFETAEKYNAKIIGGLYHLKRAPWAPVAGWETHEGDKMIATNVNGNPWKSEFSELNAKNPNESVVEVEWCGSGAMLIHRDVIDAIGWPPFLDVWGPGRGTRETGHDVNFCVRAREKGFKVYVDTRVDCAHGTFYYFGKAFAKAAAKAKLVEEMGGIVQDQTLEKDYWDTVWGQEHLKSFSREVNYPETLENIAKLVELGASVVDVGSGPGVLLDHLRKERQIKGTGYDFSEKAVSLLKEKGFDGRVVDVRNYSPNGDAGAYDVVVSMHTIEHIREDKKMVQLMKSLCRPGGKVIIATPWREEIQGHFEHVRGYSDEDMDALMKQEFTQYTVAKNNRDYVAVGQV